MALQIRRGSDAERQGITPSEGELIYVTDTNQLYIGGKIAPSSSLEQGGIIVSGDLVNDTSPTLSGDLDLNNNDITGTGNININGTITATGNINLGDGVEDNVIVGGQIASSLTPKMSNTYDLGDTSSTWRKVHTQEVVAGTVRVDGEMHSNGANIDGELLASNIVTDGNITKTDSTVIYNGTTGDLTLDGIVEAAGLKGSVFGDDSTLLVDGLTNSLNTSSLNFHGAGFITTGNNELNIGFIDSVVNPILTHWNPEPGIVSRTYGLTDGTSTIESAINCSKGTLDTPLPLLAGDLISAQYFSGWENTSNDYTAATGVVHYIDPNATVSGSNMPGAIALFTIPDGNPDNTENALTLDSEGLVSIGRDLTQARATLDIGGTMALAVLTSAPASPVSGMVAIADGTSWDPLSNGQESMVVYLNSGWRAMAVGA